MPVDVAEAIASRYLIDGLARLAHVQVHTHQGVLASDEGQYVADRGLSGLRDLNVSDGDVPVAPIPDAVAVGIGLVRITVVRAVVPICGPFIAIGVGAIACVAYAIAIPIFVVLAAEASVALPVSCAGISPNAGAASPRWGGAGTGERTIALYTAGVIDIQQAVVVIIVIAVVTFAVVVGVHLVAIGHGRAVVAYVAPTIGGVFTLPVDVAIILVGVGNLWAVVADIAHLIDITVLLEWVDMERAVVAGVAETVQIVVGLLTHVERPIDIGPRTPRVVFARAVVAEIAHGVVIDVDLIRIGHYGAVVVLVGEAVIVQVGQLAVPDGDDVVIGE